MKVLAALLILAATLGAAERFTFWIEGCNIACDSGDAQLARWASEAWQRESGGTLAFDRADWETNARFKLRWTAGTRNLYGETRPYMLGGRRAANIFVLPETHVTSDPLLRDAIVYLTCLHEIGHGIGLPHTGEFADIMYNFANGGDINAYFGRYRALLTDRADIAKHSGISDADRVALKALYK